jgi:magnesium transporter
VDLLQKSIIYYNDREVKEDEASISNVALNTGYKVWIDLTNPTNSELTNLQQIFNIDKDALKKFESNSKRQQIMVLDDQKFTILLQLKYRNLKNLETHPIYFFVGRGWLITIHSEHVDLLSQGRKMLLKNNKILEYSIDALYYSIITSIIDSYELLVTAIELKLLDFEKDAQYRPSKTTLTHLDLISKQSIMIRRYFWHARNIINYLKNTEQDNEDIKYLNVVYDDINQLIDMVESYRDTINSTREIFSSSISLQLNETMRILTIFSTIILPLSLMISIFSMEGFNLNNLTLIPRHFGIVVVVMVTMIGISLFLLWKKNWILSKDKKFTNEEENDNDNHQDKQNKKN